MRYIYILLMTFFLSGCNGNQLEHAIDKAMIATSGNKPPVSFKIANLQTMRNYVFDMKGYTIALPSAKEKDFSTPYGWQGFTHYDKDITLYLEGYYHITTSTSYKASEYGERDRSLENSDIQYLRSNIRIDKSDKLYIKRFGKEKYICEVMEYTKEKYLNSKYIGYSCYKYNANKTKAKKVHIRLTYNKPKNPTLAKEYTYEDLKRRAKRMLDSLYIKDGW